MFPDLKQFKADLIKSFLDYHELKNSPSRINQVIKEKCTLDYDNSKEERSQQITHLQSQPAEKLKIVLTELLTIENKAFWEGQVIQTIITLQAHEEKKSEDMSQIQNCLLSFLTLVNQLLAMSTWSKVGECSGFQSSVRLGYGLTATGGLMSELLTNWLFAVDPKIDVTTFVEKIIEIQKYRLDQARLEQQREEITRLESQIQALHQKHQDTLKQLKTSYEEKIESLDDQILYFQATQQQHQDGVDKLNTSHQIEIDTLGDQIATLTDTNQQNQESIRKYQEQVAQLQAQLSGLDTKCHTQQETIGALNQTIGEQEQTIEALKETIDEQEQTIGALQEAIDAQEQAIADQQGALDTTSHRVNIFELLERYFMSVFSSPQAIEAAQVTQARGTRIVTSGSHGLFSSMNGINHYKPGDTTSSNVRAQPTLSGSSLD